MELFKHLGISFGYNTSFPNWQAEVNQYTRRDRFRTSGHRPRKMVFVLGGMSAHVIKFKEKSRLLDAKSVCVLVLKCHLKSR